MSIPPKPPDVLFLKVVLPEIETLDFGPSGAVVNDGLESLELVGEMVAPGDEPPIHHQHAALTSSFIARCLRGVCSMAKRTKSATSLCRWSVAVIKSVYSVIVIPSTCVQLFKRARAFTRKIERDRSLSQGEISVHCAPKRLARGYRIRPCACRFVSTPV